MTYKSEAKEKRNLEKALSLTKSQAEQAVSKGINKYVKAGLMHPRWWGDVSMETRRERIDSIDTDEVKDLASRGAAKHQIAYYFKISPMALMEEERLHDAWMQGRAMYEISISQTQHTVAVKDKNVKMLIHLGEHALGQKRTPIAQQAQQVNTTITREEAELIPLDEIMDIEYEEIE